LAATSALQCAQRSAKLGEEPGIDMFDGRYSMAGVILFCLYATQARAEWHFVDGTLAAQAEVGHWYQFGMQNMADMTSGGAAGGDLDNDGDIDLVVVRADLGPPAVLLNRGAGVFDPAVNTGLSVASIGAINGATLADVDGNGTLDVFFGGSNEHAARLWSNDGQAHFTLVAANHEFAPTAIGFPRRNSYSASFADVDRDGDLDLALGHWDAPGRGGGGHLWLQQSGAWTSAESWFAASPWGVTDFSFTPSFADFNSDGWPDLAMTSDFGTTRWYRNQAGSGMLDQTSAVISDENGMGSAIADYDNDGDLDWFVSAVWWPGGPMRGGTGTTGNRLYRNTGSDFEDATDSAGVRAGYWGWGSCFADFNHDGWLDLFHVNGWPAPQQPGAEFYSVDPARLFVGNGDGTFTERSAALGIADTGQGRAVVCADIDNDGDIDVLTQNTGDNALSPGMTRLWRNEEGNVRPWLRIRLRQPGSNRDAIGARVRITAAGITQMRELAAGNNYLSSNPIEAHFGFGLATGTSMIEVRWPDGMEERFAAPPLRQRILLIRGQGTDLFADGME
jgi:enediyne biosynthesis protein E4